jgi:hypothetical protein
VLKREIHIDTKKYDRTFWYQIDFALILLSYSNIFMIGLVEINKNYRDRVSVKISVKNVSITKLPRRRSVRAKI